MPPSKSELWSQLLNIIKLVNENYNYASVNTPNFITLQETIITLLKGNHTSATVSALNSIRGSLISIVANNSILTPVILELARIGYNSKATSYNQAIIDIFDGMIAGLETIKNRAWTNGTVTVGGSNVGTGTVYRLDKDYNNQIIETGIMAGGTIKLETIRDKNNGGVAGAETFDIYYTGTPPTDALELGSALNNKVNILVMPSESGKLTNASFETYTTSPALAFTGWTLSDATKFATNTSIYFKAPYGVSTGTSLEFTDNANVVQYITDAASRFNLELPVFLILRYRRKTSCDGDLTLRLGSQTVSVADLTTKTDATWFDLILGTGDNKGWYRTFKEDSIQKGVRIQVTLASRTTGSLLIDNIILAQPQTFDGKYYLITPGQTDFLYSDYFNFADTVANTGTTQTGLSRLLNIYLPHTSGVPTYADI
jgi:hypothetical protein